MEIISFTLLTAIFLFFFYWMIKEREFVKKQYHANSNHHLSIHTCNYSVEHPNKKEEGKILTQEEYEAYKILSKVPERTIAGAAIRFALDRPCRAAFRKLISELKDQCRDAPDGIKKVIGEDGYNAVMNCKAL